MLIVTWTKERVDALRNYVDAGMSCSQIAGEIGVTRNAVIGKIHRLGLSGRAAPTRPGRVRGVGGALLVYGLLLAGVAFTY